LTTRKGQKTNRRTPEDKLITRGPTEHQRITSHLLVEVEQIGVVIPKLVDLERAVMEDDGIFFFTATVNCVREVFSLGGKQLARVQVETR
jgi:hypothetical protein